VKDITNKVFAGFGKIDIRYPIIEGNYSDTLISTLPIKWGKINGEVREMYSDSTLRAIYNYKMVNIMAHKFIILVMVIAGRLSIKMENL